MKLCLNSQPRLSTEPIVSVPQPVQCRCSGHCHQRCMHQVEQRDRLHEAALGPLTCPLLS
jgi:hypothetical protein